jgi:hypothetical protein
MVGCLPFRFSFDATRLGGTSLLTSGAAESGLAPSGRWPFSGEHHVQNTLWRFDTSYAGWGWSLSPMIAAASASALAPMPKARSTMRASPQMSCVRLKIAA